jgi:hypothetical protein
VLRPSGTLLLLLVLVSALLAVGAGNAARPVPKHGFFDVTVRGKVVKRRTYVENNPATECAVRRRSTGREEFTFRSRRPTRVLVRSTADGRLLIGALLRHIAGTYRQTGTRSDRSTRSDCPAPVSYSTRCRPPARAVGSGGTIGVSAPRKGIVRLSKLRLPIRLPRALSACEPRAVANLPTRAEIAAARVRPADVFDEEARAVEFETGASETSTFSGGDSGCAVVDVSWTVAFEPVAG